MPLEFQRPFGFSSDLAFGSAVTLSMPLEFQRPFGFSSDLAFGSAVTLSSVTAAVTLPKPTPALALSRVFAVTAAVTCLPPVPSIRVAHRHLVIAAVTLPAPMPAVVVSQAGVSRVAAAVLTPRPVLTLAVSGVHVAAGFATLPAPTPGLALSQLHAVTAAAAWLGPTLNLQAAYDNNVWRGVIGKVDAPLQATAVQNQVGELRSAWVDSRHGLAMNAAPWGIPAELHTGNAAPHRQATQADALNTARFAEAQPLLDTAAGSRFIQLQPLEGTQASAWQFAVLTEDRATGSRFIQLIVRDETSQGRYRWTRVLTQPDWRSFARWAKVADRSPYRIPWHWGRALTGISVEPPEPPEPPPPPISNDIDFIYPFLLTADIEFVRIGPRRIPLRRTYFVLHEIAITRVSDGAELHFADATLSADTGSWGWSLSGNALGEVTYGRLVAAPFTEINVRLNGIDWRFLITSVSHSRVFGKASYSVTGVSPALALTTPLSGARSRLVAAPWAMNQLADQEVEDTPWTVNWTAPSWLIPGGTWQYSQQTPLQALGTLAEAAGAFVQAERVNRVIQIAPRYPAWPWSTDWLFQSVSWPVAILKDLKRSPKPGNAYNAVYVAGTTSDGIMGEVKREGTAGDRQPGPPLCNPLVTHADAARALGGSYLADQAMQTEVSFSTFLGGDAPLVTLGSRIDLTEPGHDPQRLLTQAVSIAVQRGNNAVTITQSVKGVQFWWQN
ncbi:MAG: hypothetical protein ACOYMW_16265 [Candidatus Competibacteraceae bacterium]